MRRSVRGLRNRTDTGRPVPSPQVKLAPLAAVNVIVPRRTNFPRK
jgi:hypothetical protein